MIKKDNSYIDLLDRNIFPFVEYEGFDDRYPTLDTISFDKNFYNEMKLASKDLFNIFCKTLKTFQNCSNEFMELMDIPEKIRPFLNIKNEIGLPTWLSRFDFVLDENEHLKMVEINADTPCAIIEAYYGNEIASSYFNKINPNNGEYEKLKIWLDKIAMKCINPTYNIKDKSWNKDDIFLFSCFHDYIEDYGTTKFLMNALKENNNPLYKTKFESFYDLAIDENGILLQNSEHVKAIYRLHPIELLIEEISDNEIDLGVEFMKKYEQGCFEMFNPPESIIMQSKGFQALVWAMYEKECNFFTSEENKVIEKYMLPSYFEDDFNIYNKNNDNFIKKPIWGREGKGISIIDKDNNVIEEKLIDEEICAEQRDCNKYLFQKFVNGKSYNVNTDSGQLDGFLTLSCFMLGNEASAVYGRFSTEKISGVEAYWVPLTIER